MNGAVFRPVGTLSVYHALGLPGGVLPSSIPVAGAMAANATTLVPIQQHPVWMHTSTLRGPLMAMGPRVSSDPAEGNRNDKAVKASALAVAGTLAMGAEGCHAGGEQDVALQVMVWGSIAMLAAFGAVVVPAVLRAARGGLHAGRDYVCLLEMQKQVSRWEQMSSQEQCEQVRQWLEIVNGDQSVQVRCAAKESLLQVAVMTNTDHDAIAQEFVEYKRAGGTLSFSIVEALSDHLGDEARLRLLLMMHLSLDEWGVRNWDKESVRTVLDVPDEELKNYYLRGLFGLFYRHADAFPPAARQFVIDRMKEIVPYMSDFWMATYLSGEERGMFLDKMIQYYVKDRYYPYELVGQETREILRDVFERYGHELSAETLESVAHLLRDLALQQALQQGQEGDEEMCAILSALLSKLTPDSRKGFSASLRGYIERWEVRRQKEGEQLREEQEALEVKRAEYQQKADNESTAFQRMRGLMGE